MTMRAPIIDDRSFDNAESFLRALDPLEPEWRPDPGQWIYRGQADSTWPLVASAHRRRAWKDLGLPLAQDEAEREAFGDPDIVIEDPARERWLMDRFRAALNHAGFSPPALPPPNGGFGFGSALSVWPERDDIPLLALAQHEGLPTRLLDWTRHSRNAAYFAASDCVIRGRSERSRMSVFALRAEIVPLIGNGRDFRVRIEEAPLWSNPNLRAQGGLFTVCPWLENASEVFPNGARYDIPTSLEDQILHTFESIRPAELATKPLPALYRFDLPVQHAPALLRLLWDQDVHGGRMFPTYAGVLRRMQDEHRWDAPPPHAVFQKGVT